MKSSDFSKDELTILEGATGIYDTFDPIIKRKIKLSVGRNLVFFREQQNK